MSAKKFSLRRVLPVLLCSGALVSTIPTIVEAQTNPGFSLIWGGNQAQPERQLSYVLQYGTPGHLSDRWRLALGKQEVAMSSIRITTPDYFTGKFNEKNIELREAPKSRIFNLKKGKSIPLASVTLDEDNGVLEVIPEAPIPAGQKVEVVLNKVQNPKSGGMFFLNCSILSPGDEVPLHKNVGTWVLSIFRS